MQDDSNSATIGEPDELEVRTPGGMPVLTFDPKRYIEHVAEFDLNDEQKQELLQTVWSIVVSFVDLGFGFHPVQRVMDVGNFDVVLAVDSGSAIRSQQDIQQQFEREVGACSSTSGREE